MQIDKTKLIFAAFSVLLHLYLFSAFSLTDILRPEVSDVWWKEPRAAAYILAFPVTKQARVIDAPIQETVRTHNPSYTKQDINKGVEMVLKQAYLTGIENSVSEKKDLSPKPGTRNDAFTDRTDTVFTYTVKTSPSLSLSNLETNHKPLFDTNPQPRRKKNLVFTANPALLSGNKNFAGDDLLRYTRIVKDKIAKHITYPQIAKKKAIEGEVKIKFLISKNGVVRDIKLVSLSKYRILDQAALESVNRAGPFMPLPVSPNKSELWLSMTISFKLDN